VLDRERQETNRTKQLLLAPAVLVEGPVWALIGHRNGLIRLCG